MKLLLILILIAVLIIVIFIFTGRKESEEGVMSETQKTASPLVEKSPVVAMETIRKQGELKDVLGGDGSAMAQVLFSASGGSAAGGEDGKFTHSVIALIPDLPSGQFYEGWLVKKEGGQVVNFFSTGKMTKEGGAYILNFEDTKDYPEHNDVVITLEEVDDKKPEKHILEGTLSVVSQ